MDFTVTVHRYSPPRHALLSFVRAFVPIKESPEMEKPELNRAMTIVEATQKNL